MTEFSKIIENILHADNKYSGTELNYILEYLDYENGQGKGVWVEKLERAFSSKFKTKYSIAHNSGTSTLHSCLSALDIGYDDEIIGPVQTGIWFYYVCLQQNAVPVYVDSDADSFNMDPLDVERKITKKTKAIIATHMHGTPCNISKIKEIGDKYNIPVIEDCAQAFLAEHDGNMVGQFGVMASYSFETKKHMTSDQGGMVTCNDKNLAMKVRKHGGLGYKALTADGPLRGVLPEEFQDPHYKRHDDFGYNYRMPDVCAAIGLAQLERLDTLVKRRRDIASNYLDLFSKVDWFQPQMVLDNQVSSYWSFVGKISDTALWKPLYNKFRYYGGDGFFGGLANQLDEPVVKNKLPLKNYASFYENDARFQLSMDMFPVAERTQPKLIQFKTGWRDLKTRDQNLIALKKAIKEI